MATTRRTSADREVEYPTSDGRPMAETDVHRQDMVDLIETLQDYFAAEPNVYVTGNLLLFYERGNKRRRPFLVIGMNDQRVLGRFTREITDQRFGIGRIASGLEEFLVSDVRLFGQVVEIDDRGGAGGRGQGRRAWGTR